MRISVSSSNLSVNDLWTLPASQLHFDSLQNLFFEQCGNGKVLMASVFSSGMCSLGRVFGTTFFSKVLPALGPKYTGWCLGFVAEVLSFRAVNQLLNPEAESWHDRDGVLGTAADFCLIKGLGSLLKGHSMLLVQGGQSLGMVAGGYAEESLGLREASSQDFSERWANAMVYGFALQAGAGIHNFMTGNRMETLQRNSLFQTSISAKATGISAPLRLLEMGNVAGGSGTSRIPGHGIFLWCGRSLPLHAVIAVESFLQQNPRMRAELHVFDQYPENCPNFNALQRNPRVDVHRICAEAAFEGLDLPVQELQSLYERIPKHAYSARSNLLRLAVLYRRGGIYLDLDTITLRSLDPLLQHPAFIGEEQIWKVGATPIQERQVLPTILHTLAHVFAYVLHRGLAKVGLPSISHTRFARGLDNIWTTRGLNNAVLGAVPKSPWIKRLLEESLQASPSVRYALGPRLVSDSWRKNSSDVVKMSSEAFYCEPPLYSFRFFEGPPPPIPTEAFLIHYVSSNHPNLKRLTREQVQDGRDGALFYRLANRVLDSAENENRD